MSTYTYTTSVTIAGIEYDDVDVVFECSPAEPLVNWPGGIDIISITHQGLYNLTGKVVGKEMSDLMDRCSEYAAEQDRSYAEEEADAAYERQREREVMGEDW